MNIWLINQYASTPQGSVGTRHYDLSKELVARGHHVSIIASAFLHHGGYSVKLSKHENYKIQEYDGIRYIWIRTYPYERNDWRRYLGMLNFMFRVICLRREKNKIFWNEPDPQVIVGSSVHLLAALSAYFLASKYKSHFIMEVRDLWPQTLVDMGVLGNKNPIVIFLRILERFLYQKAERIISLLPYANDYIIGHGGVQEKIRWIPNGVSLSPLRNPKREENNKFRIVYIGAHGQANDLDNILKTAKIVQDNGLGEIQFLLVGRGPEKSRLIELSKKMNLNYVKFQDPINKNEVPEFLEKADVLIFNLKRTDVFKYGISSNKLFDYMAAAKPVVFSANSKNNPVHDSGCGISIPPNDPEAMSQAINDLYHMAEEERKEMGNRGRRYIEQNHDWKILADRFEKVLAEI